MIDASLMVAILDSLKDPVVFVDTNHVIRYMNKAAIAHFDDGVALVERGFFDAAHDLGHKGIGDRGHNQSNRVCLAR